MKSGVEIIGKEDGTWLIKQWVSGFPYGLKVLSEKTFDDIAKAYRHSKLLQMESITIRHDVIDTEVAIEIEEREENKAKELKELKRLMEKYECD